MIHREIFFDYVRDELFGGSLSQSQVDGMNAILDTWEARVERGELPPDRRWLGYALATTAHETGFTMRPIEEYGYGQGQPYGVADLTTGQTYYGRGFVQLTWRENYAKADKELDLTGAASCEWHADNALDPVIAADVMFRGMKEGWFREDAQGKQTFARYFNDHDDEPYGAREIINGDKHIVPSWSNGTSIGRLIEAYYMDFVAALNYAWSDDMPKPPHPDKPGKPDKPEVTLPLAPGGVVTVITIRSEGPIEVTMHDNQEDDDAEQVQGAGEADAGRGAQPGRGEEGRDPAVSGERVRSGRQGPKSPKTS